MNKREQILDEMVRDFLIEKIEDFPRLCLETRKINKDYGKEIYLHGNKTPTRMVGGKVHEGTSGWSRDGNFRHRWVIPMQLKFFMINLIYTNFWEDSNRQVKDSFMKAVLRGDDPLLLLKKVRAYYGPNPNKPDEEITVHISDIP